MIFNMIGVSTEGSGGIIGGSKLNYAVKAYSSESAMTADTPNNNTIGVITSTEITDHVFSATQPTGSTGRVWIKTGTSSQVSFNALLENQLIVYPLFAKQYVSGAWKDVTYKSYQNGVWVDWWTGVVIIEDGVVNSEIGFSNVVRSEYTATVTNSSGYIVYTGYDTDGTGSGVCSNSAIDLTDWSTITADLNVVSCEAGGDRESIQGISVIAIQNVPQDSSSSLASNVAAYKKATTTGRQTIKVDVSKLSGRYYVGIASDAGNVCHIYKLVVE